MDFDQKKKNPKKTRNRMLIINRGLIIYFLKKTAETRERKKSLFRSDSSSDLKCFAVTSEKSFFYYFDVIIKVSSM